MPRPKQRKGQQAGSAEAVVYRRAYWFDRARSLCELHGWPRSESGGGLGHVGRYTAAVNRPVGRLGADELHMLFTHHCEPHFLVPVALDLMRVDVSAYRELLRCVLRLEAGFWRAHPVLEAELVALVDGKFADEGDELSGEVTRYIERRRVR